MRIFQKISNFQWDVTEKQLFFFYNQLTYVNYFKEDNMRYYWMIVILAIIIMLLTGCTPY